MYKQREQGGNFCLQGAQSVALSFVCEFYCMHSCCWEYAFLILIMFLFCREAVSSSEKAEKELKSVTANESAYYTLFVLNSLYLVSFIHIQSFVLQAQHYACNVVLFVSCNLFIVRPK